MTTTKKTSVERPLSSRESSVLPQHQPWLQNLQRELLKNPQYCTTSPEIYSPQVQSETGQTQFDSFDYLRALAQQGLDPTHFENYQQLQSQLEQEVQRDLRVFLQEHYLLRHQSNVWELNPEAILDDWLASGEKAVAKARVRRDESPSESIWKTRHIKYRRFQLETQQIAQMKKLIAEFIEQHQWTTAPAAQILGETTPNELTKVGITFPKEFPDKQLHPGRLLELGLQPDAEVEVSPKFSLLMPANGFVHPGNLAYAVMYQVVRQQFSPGQFHYWLVSDHYYSQLSLEELQTTLEQWQPQKTAQKSPTEEMLMQVVETLPPSFTTTKPFLLFLQLAETLNKEVSLPGGYSFAFEQKHLSQHINKQDKNVKQASALLTQILLTELALCEYYPERQEFVGQILHDMFDKVVLALLHSTDGSQGEFTQEMYREILGLYNELYVSQNLGGRPFATAPAETEHPQQPTLAEVMADDRIYGKQERSAKKRFSELAALNNLFLMSLTNIPNATQGIFSCAACAGGMFGKMRGVGQAASDGFSGAASSSRGFGGNLPWYASGLGGFGSQGDVLGRDLHRGVQQRMDSFLTNTHSNAASAVGGFLSTISAGELGTFMLVSENQFAQLR
jgi:hypothetical protein